MDITPVLNKLKWKMTFDMFKEQTEDEQKAGLPQEGIRVQVNILKVDDERVCVDFTRVAGNSWYFYDQFKLLKENLKDLSDAVLAE